MSWPIYTFRHALVRDAAHQSMLERERRRLHGAIAAVLQAHFGPLCDSQPELLALHQEQAGQWADALAGWERAARHAARRSAHHEATARLKRALALLARLPDRPNGPSCPDSPDTPVATPPAGHDATELRLQLLLSGLLIATQGYGADQVGAVYDRALVLARSTGWALWEMGRADEALDRARQGVALAEQLQHPFSLGQALGFLAVAHYFRGELAPGLLAARRAIAVCESGGFVQWLAHAQVLHGRLRAALGEPDAGLAECVAMPSGWPPVRW